MKRNFKIQMQEENFHSLKQRWIFFLKNAHNEAKNQYRLSGYFFREFSSDPEYFYKFLFYLKHYLSENKKPREGKQVAEKYLSVVSPICERFSFFHEKNELDDICFEILDKKTYKKVSKMLDKYKKESDKYIRKISKRIREVLKNEGFDFTIKARYKNKYSVYRKLKKKNLKKISKLNDVFACRIILKDNDPKTCFLVLDVLHNHFDPIVEEYKDYINIPKINGYQSLHTALQNIIPEIKIPIEVQIRTKEMDKIAEKGFAAHWIYSKNKKAEQITEKEEKLLQYYTTANVEKDFVYFLAYDGTVIKLLQGSKLIDFAYKIHTSLGNNLKEGIVNGEKKNIDYEIREGDLIKLIKSQTKQLKKDWQNITNNRYTLKAISHELS